MATRPTILAQCRILIPAAILFVFGGMGNSALAQDNSGESTNPYDQTVNIASFGGSYTRSQMLAYVRPWEAETGKVANMHDYDGSLSPIKAQVSSANVKWDVVDMERSNVIAACQDGYLEPVDSALIKRGADGTPMSEDIPQEYLTECGYPSVVWSTVFAYNDNAFPNEKPSSVADFFNVEKFPGPRAVRREARGLLEWALLADGVAPSDIYSTLSTPEGLERAFGVAESIKSNIVWWSAGHEPVEMLNEGTAVMATAWNGRLYDSIKAEQPIKIIWDAQMVEIEYWAILKGSPRMANAKDFVRFALQTENMAAQTKYIPYGPVRKSSQKLISDDMIPYLPTSNLESAIQVDSEWWAENMVSVGELFTEWSTPKHSEVAQADRF